jgi:hypothetical protein
MIEFISKLNETHYQIASQLLLEAQMYQDFENKYSENLRTSGERFYDGALYQFDLPNEHSLYIEFEKYAFVRFSLVAKSHTEIIHYF